MKYHNTLPALLLAAAILLSLAGCGAQNAAPVGSTQEDPQIEQPKQMVYIYDQLYYNTGRESDITARCGVMDGSIETTVDEMSIPTKNNQSNFGTGYEYQLVAENAIDVVIDGKWIRFETRGNAELPFEEDLDLFAAQTGAELLSGTENICYSPISLYYALAMAGTGAAGETQTQIYSLLGAADSDELAKDCAALYSILERDEKNSKLYLANSVWTNKACVEPKEAYIERLKNAFHAELFRVNFDNQTNGKMTNWVEKNTNGLLAPEFDHGAQTVEVLLNTIYFKDAWSEPIYESQTKMDTFMASDGTQCGAEFMHVTTADEACVEEDYTSAALRFQSGAEMIFVLPDEDITLERLLAKRGLQDLLANRRCNTYSINWSIPKFQQECEMNLIPMLQTLGIRDAFDPYTADFSAASDTDAYISMIRQGTCFAVDEKGVEAAAYTEIAKDECAPLTDAVLEMNLNRPFLYAVRSADGTLLFIGVCEQAG